MSSCGEDNRKSVFLSPCSSKEGKRLKMMTVDESFTTMLTLFNPDAAKGLNKTFQWRISGEQGGTWAMQIADQQCQLIPGGVEHPDLIFSLKDTDWLAIVERKLDPTQAILRGKVKIKGNMMLGMRVSALFPLKG